MSRFSETLCTLKTEQCRKKQQIIGTYENRETIISAEENPREEHNSVLRKQHEAWSSYKERREDALAPGADEGRSDLRKATGSRKQALYPWMPEWGNPAG